ncbi:hypothetical protein BLA29_003560 [Euroglyphus maynei]|uniref:Transcriptional regulator ATRX-like protein n=1 Tax=Euroglyphus maynei TaxID=6958 RepID=A0A1Y3BCC2_EURMA|nr:hypothetical protein BLA29_003560 [Euroglyphus maynei]
MYNCTIGSAKRLQQNINDQQSINGCILAHSMGLGKTLQIVTFIHSVSTNEIIKKYIQKVLIIVPYNVAQNWHDEFEKWFDKCTRKQKIRIWKMYETKSSIAKRRQLLSNWDFYGGVMIITSRMATNMIDNLDEKSFRRSLTQPDLVIVDEGHLLKNNQTAFYKALTKIKTERRIILTGTPLQNNLSEYFFMVDFIKPKLLGKHERFKTRFEKPINNGQLIDSTDYEVKLMKKRIHVLTKMLKNYVHRCDYEILVPYLPPKHEYVIGVRMTSIQSRLYRYYITNVTTITRKNLLNDSRILMLICNHPSLLLKYHREKYDKENFDNHQEFWWKKVIDSLEEKQLFDMKFGSKFTLIFSILAQCKRIGDKILIFSQSILTLNYLEKLLNEQNWIKNSDYFRIDGNVEISERHEVISKFNNPDDHRARLMLISIRAGGIGINLIGANRAILIDCSWNPAIDSQAIFRVFRLGQTKPVYIYRLVSYGTMEWKIYERQVQKQSLSKRVIDEQHVVRNYTRAQLEEMYRFQESPDLLAIPELPNDNLLADLLLMHDCERSIISYHEHDSLLAQLPEEELDDGEKLEAWVEYTREKMKSDNQPLATEKQKNNIPLEQQPEIITL